MVQSSQLVTSGGQVVIWDYKLRQSQQQERYKAYSLDVDGFSQGLIFFIETQLRLVYVKAISSALIF